MYEKAWQSKDVAGGGRVCTEAECLLTKSKIN